MLQRRPNPQVPASSLKQEREEDESDGEKAEEEDAESRSGAGGAANEVGVREKDGLATTLKKRERSNRPFSGPL